MNLRDMKIGLRLGLGFGVILLAAALMLIGALISNSVSRSALLDTLERATAQQDLAEEMRRTLLASAVAVRNMGLQTEVDAVQRDEAEAKKQRASYLAAKGKLETAVLAGAVDCAHAAMATVAPANRTSARAKPGIRHPHCGSLRPAAHFCTTILPSSRDHRAAFRGCLFLWSLPPF